ncbi:MAG: CdaR family protein [Cyclobacteriaceae bacterium]
MLSKLFFLLIGNNWRVILLSLIAATTFWFFNALNKDYSTRLSYPLEFTFERDSVVIVDPLPDKVVVDVSGGGWNLLRRTFLFSATPINIAMDNPTDIKFITRSSLIPVITDQLQGLTIDFVATDTLHINVEPKIETKIAVAVDSAAVPLAEDYRLISSVRIRPDTIKVTGPKSIIDTLNPVYQIAFNESNIDYNFNDEFDIEFFSNLIRPLPDEVNVRFTVDEFLRKSIPISLETTNFPQDSSVFLKDSLITVNYTVRRRDVNKVKSADFSITADLTMLSERDSIITPILIAFPSFVMELELAPDSLKVVYGN